MDSLSSIMANIDFDMPKEVIKIKQFVHEQYNSDIDVFVKKNDIIISSRSSALIGSLHMDSLKLKKLVNENQNIRFRIA